MDLQRLGIKLFAQDPAGVDVRDFIVVFHEWIQNQAILDHLLIDIHDYSHIHNGPGILLVAHEGNFSLDMADGRLGLLYQRKQALSGNFEERLAAMFKITLQARDLIEKTGKLRFRSDEFQIIANDRLSAPNTAPTMTQMKPEVASALKQVFPGTEFTLAPSAANSKERFALSCRL